MAKAKALDTGHKPSACFLAHSLYSLGRTAEALPFFAVAGQHGAGAAAACRSGLFPEAKALALQSDGGCQMRTAELLLAEGQVEHAAPLFRAAGAHVRAAPALLCCHR